MRQPTEYEAVIMEESIKKTIVTTAKLIHGRNHPEATEWEVIVAQIGAEFIATVIVYTMPDDLSEYEFLADGGRAADTILALRFLKTQLQRKVGLNFPRFYQSDEE